MGTLLAYASARSLRAGERVAIKVSAEGMVRYRAEVVRLFAPDAGPPPHMPRFRADPVACLANGTHPARMQPLRPGSYMETEGSAGLDGATALVATLRLFPTLFTAESGALISTLSPDETGEMTGFEIGLSAEGELVVCLGAHVWHSSLSVPLKRWSALAVSIDADTGRIAATMASLPGRRLEPARFADAEGKAARGLAFGSGRLRIGAGRAADGAPVRRYNGKIERPRLAAGSADSDMRHTLCAVPPDAAAPCAVLADWDFSRGIEGEGVEDVSGHGRHGTLHQMPARGVTGSLWDTSAIDWRAKPSHYGAVHFHDDDMIDAGWEDDFVVETGADWPSGCYAVRLTGGGDAFFVPFIVRPPQGVRSADAVFLVPTCTYSAYANLRVRLTGQWNELVQGRLTVLDSTDLKLLSHPGLGLSTYDAHSDGSVVLYSGMDRPVTNFRPNGRIYKFCQDLLIVAWADAVGIDLDMVTDEDLHAEGRAALDGYRTLITGSHPEYWSTPMLDGLDDWLRDGGRMMYLGGNGFFWRTGYHPSRPGVVEVRRVGMEQLWSPTPGESVLNSVAEPGGTWQHAGRGPNVIAGVGFITQGFDANSYYRRRPDADDPRAAFIFEGVQDALIGDFGALMGGAAGYEIDRHDPELGSPDHALVLASSERHSNLYNLMVGSVVDVLPGLDENAPDALRADMVFFETGFGGAVFSVGSIAWCGSLSFDGYDNNVARITTNVLRRFNDAEPFEMPASARGA